MAFKFRDLMIDVLPKLDAGTAVALCPSPSGAQHQIYCQSPSYYCPAPSAGFRDGILHLCPVPSGVQAQAFCASPSAAPAAAQAACPAPSGALHICPAPSAVQQQAVAETAGFDDGSLAAMTALREQLQKALAQVEEREKALRAAAAAAGVPKSPETPES